VCFAASGALAQDPVKVDPQHYKVIFENDQVRVLKIHYGPHEKSVMHSHPDSVVVYGSGPRRTEDQARSLILVSVTHRRSAAIMAITEKSGLNGSFPFVNFLGPMMGSDLLCDQATGNSITGISSGVSLHIVGFCVNYKRRPTIAEK
jgi:hypothetical protein